MFDDTTRWLPLRYSQTMTDVAQWSLNRRTRRSEGTVKQSPTEPMIRATAGRQDARPWKWWFDDSGRAMRSRSTRAEAMVQRQREGDASRKARSTTMDAMSRGGRREAQARERKQWSNDSAGATRSWLRDKRATVQRGREGDATLRDA